MPAEGSIASRYSRRRIGTPRFKEAFSTLSLFIPIFNGIQLGTTLSVPWIRRQVATPSAVATSSD
jgi:hypothetical protein